MPDESPKSCSQPLALLGDTLERVGFHWQKLPYPPSPCAFLTRNGLDILIQSSGPYNFLHNCCMLADCELLVLPFCTLLNELTSCMPSKVTQRPRPPHTGALHASSSKQLAKVFLHLLNSRTATTSKASATWEPTGCCSDRHWFRSTKYTLSQQSYKILLTIKQISGAKL